MITKGITQLVAEAEAEIETLSAEEAIALMDDATSSSSISAISGSCGAKAPSPARATCRGA